jgi:FAD/FMN-containing dehydrogenase
MSSSAVAATATELAPIFAGRILTPADAGYDEGRRVHNGLIDKRPAAIAQCRGVADVADAVRIARKLGLEIAVRGGGHNPGGRGTVDNGMVIDLSSMRSVFVDPKARTARVDGGALWRDVIRETQLHNLATTGGLISTTGVGGLTLGGGLGWLMPKFGMALDNLVSVDLVMADGTWKRAAGDENADLFWAVRGGGGNFGVATSLTFKVHPLGPTIVGGLVAHPVSQARDVLRFFRDVTSQPLPDDMMVLAGLLTGPDGTKLAAILAGHFGSTADGEKALEPIKAFGKPAMDAIGPMPYATLNTMLDNGYPRGARNYWKSHFIEKGGLTDAAIDALIDRFAKCPSPMGQVLLEHFHGAAARVAPDATAYALRSEGHNLLFLSQWQGPADDEKCIAWGKESYAAARPFVGPRRYLNYMDDDDAADGAALFGPNAARLKQIKGKYDPENVFHVNVNIKP